MAEMTVDRTEKDIQKSRAREAVRVAVAKGDLVRSTTCQKCGKTEGTMQAHHYKGYDEENWLKVKWWCNECNSKDRSKKAKKDGEDMNLIGVQHSDIACIGIQHNDLLPSQKYAGDSFTRTEEGFLRGRPVVTNIGVFTYMNADGSTRRELRTYEEVFDMASLNSMKLKPVTNDHPEGAVTSENIKDLQVGTLGDDPTTTTQYYDWNGNPRPWKDISDGIHVAISMAVTQKDAVDAVLSGKQALSMGYTCDLEEAPAGATWAGMQYDYIQRNIRYNHCAIVDRGRAGDAAMIRLDHDDVSDMWVWRFDSADDGDTPKSNEDREGQTMADLKRITLDGVEHQAEGPVIAKLTQETKRADNAVAEAATEKSRADKAEGERDGYKDRVDALTKQLEAANAAALDPKKLDAAVEAKIKLLSVANDAGVELKGDEDELTIKRAIVMAAFPNADRANIEKATGDYLNGRFDQAVEHISARADEAGNAQQREDLSKLPGGPEGNQGQGAGKKTDPRYDSAAARKRMIESYGKKAS